MKAGILGTPSDRSLGCLSATHHLPIYDPVHYGSHGPHRDLEAETVPTICQGGWLPPK